MCDIIYSKAFARTDYKLGTHDSSLVACEAYRKGNDEWPRSSSLTLRIRSQASDTATHDDSIASDHLAYHLDSAS